MKNSIKLTALSLLLFSGAFASAPTAVKTAAPAKNAIEINGLFTKIGVMVSVPENTTVKTLVTISDNAKDVLYKGVLGGSKKSSKTYNLAELPIGDYTIKVSQNSQEMTKKIHIFDNSGQKDYFIIQ